ncbi:MAG: TIGR03960 family B12-binding radical SAM protein [Clostridiales bacterium]
MEKIRIEDISEQELFSKVEKPAQYIGGEYNSISKDWSDIKAKMAFLFPDTYEIGMSHLGLRLLYEAVNSHPHYLMERAFAPMADMEALLREREIPLFSWETRHLLRDFDVLGFTLQYELSYTNILNMLNLAGLPLLSKEREDWPLVIAGGPCVYNPEPLADFIDLFIIGEGEEVILELMAKVAEVRSRGGSKQDFLAEIRGLGGVYIPNDYQIEYDEEGKIISVQALNNAPAVVQRRIIKDFDQAPFPVKGILPNIRVVHDRLMLEIMRGCCRGCRFCQAGIIYRPVREKDPQVLLKQAREHLAATGYDEMGLISLSSADYTEIGFLVDSLLAEHSCSKVGISLPSLRADAFSVDLAHQVQQVRKSGLTFAPEAGSQRLRDSINKGVCEEDIMTAVRAAFCHGWNNIKLYFMIGLPGETDEDILGIAAMCRKIIACARENRVYGSRKPLKISVGVSSLVPKCNTPFQWKGQNSQAELRRKQNLLRDAMRPMRQVSLSCHRVEESSLESVFARGGRELGKALILAWSKGCRFDGWSEHFNYYQWSQAFIEAGLDLEALACQDFAQEQILPWDHISCGVEKSWLWQEKEKSELALITEDCRQTGCNGCGICDNLSVENHLQKPWSCQ